MEANLKKDFKLVVARMAKWHSAAPHAISLPFSTQVVKVKFIPNFTPARATTYTNANTVTTSNAITNKITKDVT